MHVRKVKGKDSFFIGATPIPYEAKNSNEAEDQTTDSFLEFLDGFGTPLKRDPSSASQSILYDSSSSSYLGIINKLIDNNALLTTLLKYEKDINKELAKLNSELKLKLQSLETWVHEIVSVVPKLPGLQTRMTPLDNDLIVYTQATNSAEKREIFIDCAKQRIKDQWNEMKISFFI